MRCKRGVQMLIDNKKGSELDRLLYIVETSEKHYDELDYKEKQQYFKAKNKLCRVFHRSKDNKGNGITYRKEKSDVK